MTIFNIDSYSYCPIDNKNKFVLKFDNHRAYCYFNSNYSLIKENNKIFKTYKILKATCFLKGIIDNFNNFYFPKAFSENISNIKIINYYQNIPFIFKNYFLDKETNKYCLKTFFYKSFDKGYNITIKINSTKFFCVLYNNVIYLNNEKPILENFECGKLNHSNNNNEILDINKINSNLNKCNHIDVSIPNQFIISKIYREFINKTNFIIIRGKLFDNLKCDIYNLTLFLIYPKESLNCFIKSASNYIQAYIYCKSSTKKKKISINNQIIYSNNCHESLLLINKEIYFQNYQIINSFKIDINIIKQMNVKLRNSFFEIDYINYIIILIFIAIKVKIKYYIKYI